MPNRILLCLAGALATVLVGACATADRELDRELADWGSRAQTLDRRHAAERERSIADLREIAVRHEVEASTPRVPNDAKCGKVGDVYSERDGEQCVVTHKTSQYCDLFCVPIVGPEGPSPAEPI